MVRGQTSIKWLIILLFFFCFEVRVSAGEMVSGVELIECDEANGKAGYYVEKPKVYVNHLGKNNVTKILFTKPDGGKVEETLDQVNHRFCIDEELFMEGTHKLEVWQEDQNGIEIEETKVEKEFLIDTKVPDKLEIRYEKFGDGETLYFSDKTYVWISAEDVGSGIENLYYRMGEGQEIKSSDSKVKVEIPLNYEGRVIVWAEDTAGNKTSLMVSKQLVCESQKPVIAFTSDGKLEGWNTKPVNLKITVAEKGIASGIAKVNYYLNGKPIRSVEKEGMTIAIAKTAEVTVTAEDYAGNQANVTKKIFVDGEVPQVTISGSEDEMISNRNIRIRYRAEDGQKLTAAKMIIKRKDRENKEKILEHTEWKKEERIWEANHELTEDGIYSIEFQARDEAGNQVSRKQQIIIDKTSPLIRNVKELQGKYLEEFQWNYEVSEMIQDFSRYTYEIRLDGKLRSLPIVEKREGKHLFYIKVRDAAGNESEEKAEFIIEHKEELKEEEQEENVISEEQPSQDDTKQDIIQKEVVREEEKIEDVKTHKDVTKWIIFLCFIISCGIVSYVRFKTYNKREK